MAESHLPRTANVSVFGQSPVRRVLRAAAQCAFFFTMAQACAGPIALLRLGPIDAMKTDVTMVLSPNVVKKCAGQYRGQLLIYDVPPGINVSGVLKPVAGGCEMTATVPWSGLSEKVIQHARGDVLQVRFRGDLIDGKVTQKVDWSLAAPKADVLLTEPMKDTVKRFAKATDLHLGSIGLKNSTVSADISVHSPLPFELRVLQASCELEVHGALFAKGSKESFVILPGRPTLLSIPVTLNHKALLSATGSVVTQMGKIEGKLSGLIRVRLPGGDVDFPMEFPVQVKLIGSK